MAVTQAPWELKKETCPLTQPCKLGLRAGKAGKQLFMIPLRKEAERPLVKRQHLKPTGGRIVGQEQEIAMGPGTAVLEWRREGKL